MNAFEPNARFLNKQNVQLGSDVFAVVLVMHHLSKKNMQNYRFFFFVCVCVEAEPTVGFVGHCFKSIKSASTGFSC